MKEIPGSTALPMILTVLLATGLVACDGAQEDEQAQAEPEQQEVEPDGDDPTDTPPPETHGEVLVGQNCVVDTPRFHLDGTRTIAQLDGDYANTPFQDGANLVDPLISITLTAPGVFSEPWNLANMHASLAQAAGAGAVINSNLHLLYVEFPVNGADLCVPRAWETGESWVKGRAYAGNNQTGFTRRDIADFTKFGVAGGTPAVPGTQVHPMPQRQWLRGNGRADANFPEAWIFVDGPGLYRSHVGETEAGNYVNIRLNIRDGSPTAAIVGTAIFRMAQRLQLDGTFTSRLAGSSASNTAQLAPPPPIDPNLTGGVPANAPAPIPDLFASHPDYVGN